MVFGAPHVYEHFFTICSLCSIHEPFSTLETPVICFSSFYAIFLSYLIIRLIKDPQLQKYQKNDRSIHIESIKKAVEFDKCRYYIKGTKNTHLLIFVFVSSSTIRQKNFSCFSFFI